MLGSQLTVVVDSIQIDSGFSPIHGVGEIMPCPASVVVLDDRVVDDPRTAVVVDDHRLVDVPDSNGGIPVNTPEVVVGNHNGMGNVSERSDGDPHAPRGSTHSPYDHGTRKPRTMAVVRFPGSQGHPSDIRLRVDPGHPPRRPAAATPVGRTHGDPGHRRGPVPASVLLDIGPISVMVSHVTERFVGDPAVVIIPFRPSPLAERGPVGVHMGRTPHHPVLTVVIDSIPPSIFFELIGLVMKAFRDIPDGVPLHLKASVPDVVPLRVPIIPLSINRSVIGSHNATVGNQGIGTGNDLIPALVALQNKINRSSNGDDLERLIPHIQVENRCCFREHIAVRGGCPDNAIPALVVEAGHSGGDVDLG